MLAVLTFTNIYIVLCGKAIDTNTILIKEDVG